jgi:hypothetical protein
MDTRVGKDKVKSELGLEVIRDEERRRSEEVKNRPGGDALDFLARFRSALSALPPRLLFSLFFAVNKPHPDNSISIKHKLLSHIIVCEIQIEEKRIP